MSDSCCGGSSCEPNEPVQSSQDCDNDPANCDKGDECCQNTEITDVSQCPDGVSPSECCPDLVDGTED